VTELQALIPDLVALARQASARILQIYTAEFGVRDKADKTPVTEADELSEEIILEGLAKLTPEIPAYGEEAVSRGETTTETLPPYFWLVDPLDGTREFIARNGEFSINIGLVVERRATLGILHAPALDITWTAAGPGSAMVRRRGAAPEAIHVRRAPAGGGIAVRSRSHGDNAAVEALAAERGIRETRIQGSAIKFGLLAEGQADFYPRFGRTMEWDTCAGHAILEAAGGHVETMAGGPLLYGKPGFRNPDFVASGAL
jgi:3'(2'), 5'-bisphosphate nucleotidase